MCKRGACPLSPSWGGGGESEVGSPQKEDFWNAVSRLRHGVSAWGSLLLTDGTSPPEGCDSALAKLH